MGINKQELEEAVINYPKQGFIAVTDYDLFYQAAKAYLEQGWKTIDSAPRDGTLILVICDNAPHTAKWIKTKNVLKADFSGRFDWEGWQIIQLHGFQAINFEPLHWQPLPIPPEREGV